jgi:hypothetical protein
MIVVPSTACVTLLPPQRFASAYAIAPRSPAYHSTNCDLNAIDLPLRTVAFRTYAIGKMFAARDTSIASTDSPMNPQWKWPLLEDQSASTKSMPR